MTIRGFPARKQREEYNKKGESKMKRVSFEEYKILKVIYENVIVISACDNEALIFIKK